MWLVGESSRRLTPNRYHAGYKASRIEDVEAVIYHYTGSRRPTSTLNWLLMSKDDIVALYRRKGLSGPYPSPVSAHFLVERNGQVWQLASLDERCWHAGGRSSKLFDKGNVNGRTIGIEIMCVGPVVPKGDGWATPNGKSFTGPMVSAGGKRPGREDDYPYTSWEAYRPAQMDALVELTKKLVAEFPILTQGPEYRLTGHENVDPSRKMDVGPHFPWKLIRDAAV